ncbi:hypothetical protein B0I37DRAFT_35520 [Chaetomium sp. MPI-CAGE-AT-0009]|nr:hypothetical protein B0I37DRAFT_35520 [Chaetomium sp. MPI-CAGE-AT-0009]
MNLVLGRISNRGAETTALVAASIKPKTSNYSQGDCSLIQDRTFPRHARTSQLDAARLAREGWRRPQPSSPGIPHQPTTSLPTSQALSTWTQHGATAHSGNRATFTASPLWQAPTHAADHRDMNTLSCHVVKCKTRRRTRVGEEATGKHGGDATISASNDSAERHVHDLIRPEDQDSRGAGTGGSSLPKSARRNEAHGGTRGAGAEFEHSSRWKEASLAAERDRRLATE